MTQSKAAKLAIWSLCVGALSFGGASAQCPWRDSTNSCPASSFSEIVSGTTPWPLTTPEPYNSASTVNVNGNANVYTGSSSPTLSGYSSMWFYSSRDSAGTPELVMRAPVEGCTSTANLKCRTEFRHPLNWTPAAQNSTWMRARARVTEMPSLNPGTGEIVDTVISQIQCTEDACKKKPMARLEFEFNRTSSRGKLVFSARYSPGLDLQNYDEHRMAVDQEQFSAMSIPLNSWFEYNLYFNDDGESYWCGVEVWHGNSYFEAWVEMDDLWGSMSNVAFRVGNVVQITPDEGSGFATVRFSSITTSV